MVKKLLLLHFNDVYNIEPAKKEPVGGAARFASLVKGYAEENPLVLFSGDCLSPSLMSTMTRGKQMIPILNAVGVRVACLGNHDLDFGLDHFTSVTEKCHFPWLAANVKCKTTGHRLGNLQDALIIEWGGVKIGIMGLVEREWLETLRTLTPEDIDYEDFVEVGKRLAKEMISKGAELVVALTHMRKPNDIHLLNSVGEIDIVMGGHDHGYAVERIALHRNLLVKSGTDFRDLTKVEVEIHPHGRKEYVWEHLVASGAVAEDPEVKGIVNQFVETMGASLDTTIGFSSVDLDVRFASIRTQETNLGNFVCDVLREAARTEVCFLNSGTFRSDRIHPKGKFTKRDLLDILPMVDETVILKLSGAHLLETLENGVSSVPKLEGRFLQVSGIKFAFDPKQPAGQRIDAKSVFVVDRGATLDVESIYTVCTKDYLASGKDGFDVLKSAEVCMDCETSPVLPICIRYHFMQLDVLNAWKQTGGTVQHLVNKFVGSMKDAIRQSPVTSSSEVSATAVFNDKQQAYVIRPLQEGRITQL